ncbi:nucleotidyltransferase substrate binding protein [Clostridium sp. WILCCON 0269]|uniref:Nucleotidyltransferase substrate binding protein n=1 Tax=Candidatus Clostridium eludens TaxID=3381663 RepID=A0ABW8SR30_9CLOT
MKKLDERIYDFINALRRLREALEKDITDDIIIDGIIQRFEFTFDQSWKAMKIYLENQGVLDEALSPRSTIRVAFKHKIISNGDLWIEMMLDRNRTSHVYDEATAKSIVERIKKMYIDEFNDLEKLLKG